MTTHPSPLLAPWQQFIEEAKRLLTEAGRRYTCRVGDSGVVMLTWPGFSTLNIIFIDPVLTYGKACCFPPGERHVEVAAFSLTTESDLIAVSLEELIEVMG